MITTLNGYILLMLAMVVLLIITGSYFFYFVVVLMFINLLAMYFMVYRNAKDLQQFLYISENEASVGNPLRVEFKLSNTGILPIAHARIKGVLYNKYNEMVFPSDNIFFNPYHVLNIREEFVANKRGIFTDGKILIEYYDPLKIFKRTKLYHKDINLVVYPRVYDIDYFYLPFSGLIGTNKSSNSGVEDYSSLKKVRKYEIGDSYKRIHWKLSSKKGSMFVKEYDSSASSDMNVFINAYHEDFVNRDVEDRVVEMSAAVINYALKREIDTSMFYSMENLTQIDARDIVSFGNILKNLVTFSSIGQLRLSELVIQESKRLELGSYIVLVTSLVTDELVDTINMLMKKRFRVSLLAVDITSDQHFILKSNGAKVYHVSVGDDLKSKLEVLYDQSIKETV